MSFFIFKIYIYFILAKFDMKRSFIKRSDKLFKKLVLLMRRLRSKNGCPWDKKQTHLSLLKYLYEEASEFEDAVKKNDFDAMEEELGDILLQVVFHCQIAYEAGRFDIGSVINRLNQKLIRRHPHVFSDYVCKTPKDVKKLWAEIKKEERKNKKDKEA